MRNKRNTTIKFLTMVLAAVLFGIFSTATVSAQYGNLISKQAADALAASNLALCWIEMSEVLKKEPNNNAARVESARCTFLYATSNTVIEGYTKELIGEGKSETAAREEVKTELGKMLLGGIRELKTVTVPYAPASNLLGLYYRSQGKTAEAQAEFDRAIQLDPGNYRPYANRGKTKDMAGDTAGAIADYERAVARGATEPYLAKRISELKQTTSATAGSPNNSGKSNTGIVVRPEKEMSREELEANRAKYQDKESKETNPAEEVEKILREMGITLTDEEKREAARQAKELTKVVTSDSAADKKAVEAFMNSKSLGDDFYAMTGLLMTAQEFKKQSDIFTRDYPQSTDAQRRELIRLTTDSARKALDEVVKTEGGSQNFKPEDKKKIARYKDYYTKYLAALSEMSGQSSTQTSNKKGYFSAGEDTAAGNSVGESSLTGRQSLQAQTTLLSLLEEYGKIRTEFQKNVDSANKIGNKSETIKMLETFEGKFRQVLVGVQEAQKKPLDYSSKNKEQMTLLVNNYTKTIKQIEDYLNRLRQ